MSQTITITSKDILQNIKLCRKIPESIEQIVICKVVENAAVEAGIKVETEELQQAADSWRLMSNLRSADATWSWLQKHSLSLDDLEELVEATVISSKLAQHLFADKVEHFFVERQLGRTYCLC